jgi:hypothetical protein
MVAATFRRLITVLAAGGNFLASEGGPVPSGNLSLDEPREWLPGRRVDAKGAL